MKQTDAPNSKDRDRQVLEIYEKLLEIEQRMIPTGLHVFGRTSDQAELTDLLRMVGSFERPEKRIQALPDLVSTGLGLGDYGSLAKESRSSVEALRARESVDAVVAAAIKRLLSEGGSSATRYLRETASVDEHRSAPVFQLLEETSELLRSNREVDSLVGALRGQYIEPGPGADIIQNPSILPTGRNTHAVNPYVVPSPVALRRARVTVQALLERHTRESGGYPRSIAMVLWGIDNIKTEGEAVAQVLWLLGVRPVRDSMNRVSDVEVIPAGDLGRPRIDVVMTVSGIFRDLFGATMRLLDMAVRRVASLDEPPEVNYVRRNISEEMAGSHCSFDEAVVRVFSNAAGNYGTNVNFMVLESQWESDRELGELFVTRKSFAYGKDSQGRSFDGREAKRLFDRALSRVDVTYQNIDNTEVGITDVDHYFEYLGGVSKAVELRTGKRPGIYLADTISPATAVRTLEETIKLEARTKALNPKWYEGMLRHGFSGVAEIEHQVTNTFGWSATADAVDDWIYDGIAGTFVLDDAMLQRLRRLNPHSTRTLVGRLLEAARRGFWQAEQHVLEELQGLFNRLEDEMEGVAG